MRALGIDPVHETRETFRALLDAMSRPGCVEAVPAPADEAVVATLVDHEVALWTDDDRLRETLSDQGRLAEAGPEDADIVHVDETETDVVDVRACKRGSLVEPSQGATVVYRVDALEPGPSDSLTTVELTGPGVDGVTSLSIGLPAAELAALSDAQSNYPRGVDAVFAAGDKVAAIPRSTTIGGL